MPEQTLRHIQQGELNPAKPIRFPLQARFIIIHSTQRFLQITYILIGCGKNHIPQLYTFDLISTTVLYKVFDTAICKKKSFVASTIYFLPFLLHLRQTHTNIHSDRLHLKPTHLWYLYLRHCLTVCQAYTHLYCFILI